MFAIVFGFLTILSGGLVLFGGNEITEAAGNIVQFVLWFNFFAGFPYVAAGFGLLRNRHWAVWLSIAILACSATVLAGLVLHIAMGGAYELRTLVAMLFRTAVWALIVLTARSRTLRR
ncbi:hypothetical protein [Roseibium sp. MMSF_3412]|uniref:hypothetical protein n=1 Tax=Roseibium sp. MMSF_3412 TaxID=3046712 RepID=UPI00273D11BB|nr:hypothetical protein [Roseibium sp. MMSF_3412]